ncbi:Transmembrane emp24 domain-containing protein 6 [Calypte anna]|uniref:Transmembrane emp24 domain-containing protein 6 n=2 Tax=Calypte anna TaxID=9244 RepID=A0A091HH39_CALAN|nr:Transmembrane emp24 domain-containing protein 6 [Calypte anna]
MLLLLLLVVPAGCPRTEALSPSRQDPPFPGAGGYDFAVVIPAGEVQCFWQFAHQRGDFFFSYEVQRATGIGNQRDILATASDPRGSQLGASQHVRGQIDFHTQDTGFYQLCLDNQHNHFGFMQVYLSFGVSYEDSSVAEQQPAEKAELNNTLEAIGVSIQKLQLRAFHMWRFYNFDRMRKASDSFLLQSNHSYITRWSLAQSCLIILSGVLQLYCLKSLFNLQSSCRQQC